mmetsp:Transcript_19779/g.55199  ORF Transcript_19779/g.55199 Transcript_19779/m.55199 type:complete len:85 (+) Transcript_19779:380-634(+)
MNEPSRAFNRNKSLGRIEWSARIFEESKAETTRIMTVLGTRSTVSISSPRCNLRNESNTTDYRLFHDRFHLSLDLFPIFDSLQL